MNIKYIKNQILNEWKRNKVGTAFMGAVVILAILTYIKPSSTSGILSYLGLSVINFIFLSGVVLFIYFMWRRRKR